ncbi:hypothetical protein GPJ56_003763 [Histomonas meleagridis]|uniref:uncharacterized protein n=1 Tax=Histomonas meleagridis TaxID=135588 RepID=UPI003559F697|nr:hypothetical protein GPJ56_003763 [Histomonas meleagridis]KAH0805221.1 hypothetical protein GO595_002166 [Histomonas meleagridis]
MAEFPAKISLFIPALIILVAFIGYSLWRLNSAIIAQKTEISGNWSRFLFRILIVIFILLQVGPYIDAIADYEGGRRDKNLDLEASTQLFFYVSLVFLVRSVHDFISMVLRNDTFIKKHWLATTIPIPVFFFLLLTFASISFYYVKKQVMDSASGETVDMENHPKLKKATCSFMGIGYTVLFAILLIYIYIPIFRFLHQLSATVFGSYRNRIIFLYVFFSISIVLTCGGFIAYGVTFDYNYSIDNCLKSNLVWIPLGFLVSLVQDLIDWMLLWLVQNEVSRCSSDDEENDGYSD